MLLQQTWQSLSIPHGKPHKPITLPLWMQLTMTSQKPFALRGKLNSTDQDYIKEEPDEFIFPPATEFSVSNEKG